MDALAIAISMVLAAVGHGMLRANFGVFKDPPAIEQYLLLAWVTMPMMLGLIVVIGLHHQLERMFQPLTLIWDLLRLHAASLIGIALLVFLTQIPLNRSVVALFLGFTFVMMLLSRLALHSWRRRTHASGEGRTHLLLIGGDLKLLSLLVGAAREEPLGPEIVGILSDKSTDERLEVPGVSVLGSLTDLSRILHEQTIDEVVIATQGLGVRQFESVIAACDELGTPMRHLVLPDFHDGRRLGLERQYGLPFVTLAKLERSTEALAMKRAIDVLGSATALLLLSPVLFAISLSILLTMGRPVLFSQERIGYHGRRFRMLKFRSMVKDAERYRDALGHSNEMDGPVFKIGRDPRVTPLGRVLRKFSLDELPQLFNVLFGSMSLVGPRPLPIGEQQKITGPQRRRLSMRPGITGLWQVSGRSNLSFEAWMKLDLEYVDNWSPKLDLRLLLKTIPAVLTGRGAV